MSGVRAFVMRAKAGLATRRKAAPGELRGTRRTRALVPLAVGLCLAAGWLRYAPGEGPQASTPTFDDVDVSQRSDGLTVYHGYVQTHEQWLALRRQAARQRTPARWQIVVRERLTRQLQALLRDYFLGARLQETAPGRYRVLVSGREAFVEAHSANIEQIARAQLPGLLSLDLQQDPGQRLDPATLPLHALDANLFNGRHGSHLSRGGATRYFEGATLPEGKLLALQGRRARVADLQAQQVVDYLPVATSHATRP